MAVDQQAPEPKPRRLAWPAWLATGDIHQWVSTTALVFAAAWGVYTFVWKDILVPGWAPASITIDVEASPAKAEPASSMSKPSERVPLKIQVTATNESESRLYFLDNYWAITGVQWQESSGDANFEANLNERLKSGGLAQGERDMTEVYSEILAAGRLFADRQIQPGEKLTRDLTVHLPTRYEAAIFDLKLPALKRNPGSSFLGIGKLFGGRTMEWRYSEQADSLYSVLCSSRSDGPGGLACKQTDLKDLGQQISSFDPHAVVFFQTKNLDF